jgi:hypothetical protein
MSWNAKCADCLRASGICATESKGGLERWSAWGYDWSGVICAKESEGDFERWSAWGDHRGGVV